MREKRLLLLLALASLLSACAGPIAQQPINVTPVPFNPTPATADPSPYPPPGSEPTAPTNPIYPPPTSPFLNTAVPPSSGFEPQPGDAKLTRDQVLLDLKESSLVIRESFPPQVSVYLNGSLPDPCHQLRVVVSPPNAQKEIILDVYSVYDLNLNCIMVIKPFSASIQLGTYPAGHYKVVVNGQLIGEFDS